MMLAVGAVLVAALVARHAASASALRRLAIVAAVAFGVRLIAVAIIYFIAIRTHGEGTWLNDEASFWLATESLLPDPFDRALPQGLDHLGGNGYLGITTWLSIALGHADTLAFRLTNAVFGTFVAVLAAIVAERFIGRRAGLLAGLGVGLWPTLILWSATMLRDTLCSFIVVVLWWTLVSEGHVRNARVVSVAVLSVVLLAGLRPYVAASAMVGVAAWAVYPWLVRQSRRNLTVGGIVVLALVGGVALRQARSIDQAAHELVYRQMTTRIETLGLLYQEDDPDALPPELPFRPGVPVAHVLPSGWLLTGVVRTTLGPGSVLVAYTDGTLRDEQTADLVLLQSAPLSPLQMLAGLGPGVFNFTTGSGGTVDGSSPVWIIAALAWDVLLIFAIVGGVRARVPARYWLFPACVVAGTAAALITVSGAPGNDERHRASQAVPLLVVFATGSLAPRVLAARQGRAVRTETSSPTTATT